MSRVVSDMKKHRLLTRAVDTIAVPSDNAFFIYMYMNYVFERISEERIN